MDLKSRHKRSYICPVGSWCPLGVQALLRVVLPAVQLVDCPAPWSLAPSLALPRVAALTLLKYQISIFNGVIT